MDCSQTWLGFFLPSGRSYNCGILLGLEELLTSSPSYQLGRIVVLVLGLAKKFSRVLEWQFGVWGLFLQVLFPLKNKQNLCALGVLTPFLIYWYAVLLRVREKTILNLTLLVQYCTLRNDKLARLITKMFNDSSTLIIFSTNILVYSSSSDKFYMGRDSPSPLFLCGSHTICINCGWLKLFHFVIDLERE